MNPLCRCPACRVRQLPSRVPFPALVVGEEAQGWCVIYRTHPTIDAYFPGPDGMREVEVDETADLVAAMWPGEDGVVLVPPDTLGGPPSYLEDVIERFRGQNTALKIGILRDRTTRHEPAMPKRLKTSAPTLRAANGEPVLKTLLQPPPRSDDDEPIVRRTAPPTGVYELGGDPDRVADILRARPTWDEEVVQELIRWGATPRLGEVHATRVYGKFREVRCTFVQPDGTLVPNVWMPAGLIKSEYPAFTRALP